jgi:hypothetical protein
MAYPAYLRERARSLLTAKKLSIDEIAAQASAAHRVYLQFGSGDRRNGDWLAAASLRQDADRPRSVPRSDVHDTLLRARLQAWIDRVRGDWGLDSSAHRGVAQSGSAQPLGG